MNSFIKKLIRKKILKSIKFLRLNIPIQWGSQSLILFIRRVSVKRLLHSENFNLGKDFWHGQKVNASLFICVNELWLLNDFFFFFFFLKKKKIVFEIWIKNWKKFFQIKESKGLSFHLCQWIVSTKWFFSKKKCGFRIKLLPIYQICVAKRSSLLRKLVFFYSARIKNFSQH